MQVVQSNPTPGRVGRLRARGRAGAAGASGPDHRVSPAVRRVACAAGLALLAASTAGGPSPAARAAADDFRSLVDASMARMHRAMALPGTGDPDRDFATMMIAHHQGAVEMAEAELRFGRDERLRRLAQGIIVEQRQEIAVMRQVLETPPPVASPASARSPTAGRAHTHPEDR